MSLKKADGVIGAGLAFDPPITLISCRSKSPPEALQTLIMPTLIERSDDRLAAKG